MTTHRKTQTVRAELNSELQKTNSTKLEKRVRQLVNRLIASEPDGFKISVEVQYDDSDLTSVTFRPAPDSSWTTKSENTIAGGHVILGPRGGYRRLDWADDFTGRERDYTQKNNAWKRYMQKIDREADDPPEAPTVDTEEPEPAIVEADEDSPAAELWTCDYCGSPFDAADDHIARLAGFCTSRCSLDWLAARRGPPSVDTETLEPAIVEADAEPTVMADGGTDVGASGSGLPANAETVADSIMRLDEGVIRWFRAYECDGYTLAVYDLQAVKRQDDPERPYWFRLFEGDLGGEPVHEIRAGPETDVTGTVEGLLTTFAPSLGTHQDLVTDGGERVDDQEEESGAERVLAVEHPLPSGTVLSHVQHDQTRVILGADELVTGDLVYRVYRPAEPGATIREQSTQAIDRDLLGDWRLDVRGDAPADPEERVLPEEPTTIADGGREAPEEVMAVVLATETYHGLQYSLLPPRDADDWRHEVNLQAWSNELGEAVYETFGPPSDNEHVVTGVALDPLAEPGAADSWRFIDPHTPPDAVIDPEKTVPTSREYPTEDEGEDEEQAQALDDLTPNQVDLALRLANRRPPKEGDLPHAANLQPYAEVLQELTEARDELLDHLNTLVEAGALRQSQIERADMRLAQLEQELRGYIREHHESAIRGLLPAADTSDALAQLPDRQDALTEGDD